MSKSHPDQWTINEVAEGPEKFLVAALRKFSTTQLADCAGPVSVVAPPLRHLAGGAQLCGPAVTVRAKPGDILHVLKAVDLTSAVTGWSLTAPVTPGLVAVPKEHLASVLAMTKAVADQETPLAAGHRRALTAERLTCVVLLARPA